MAIWGEPFTKLRVPKLFNLRIDPCAIRGCRIKYVLRAVHTACYVIYPLMAIAGKWAETFKEFPPIQKPNTFTLDDALAAMSRVGGGS